MVTDPPNGFYHRPYLKSLSVEGDGLLDQSLLSLDVCQVVERISVVRIHLKSCVVTLLSLRNLL